MADGMKRKLYCLFGLLFLIYFSFTACPVPARGAVSVPQTVKIGYYYDSDYFFRDDSGNYCGYDAEYIYEVSKYTDWQCRYVNFSSFEDAYAALERGEIDVLPSLFYTQKRAETLLLSDYDMGAIYDTVITAPADSRFAYGDTDALQGKKVGILAESEDGEMYRRWASENGMQTEIVSVPSMAELLKDLDAGKLDAVAVSYLGASSRYRIIAEFSPVKMYFGMPKDHTELMKQLNTAMADITVETPDFASNLYKRYYHANQEQAPVFTAEEKAYIASAGTLTVSLPEGNIPFSWTGSNGKMTGAAVDYFKRISELSGLSFSFLSKASLGETVEAVKSGKAEIAGTMVYDAAKASADRILLTNSYLDVAATQISLKGTDTVNTLAVPSYLAAVFQNLKSGDSKRTIRYLPTAWDCFGALENGTADGAILNTFTANYYLNNRPSGRYNVTAINGYTYRLAAGVSSSADRMLYSVLNRCVRYSSSTTMNELIVKYSQTDDTSLLATISRIPPVWLAAITCVLFVSIVFLVFALASFNRRQKEKDAISAQKAEVALKESELALTEKNANEKNQFFSNISHDMRTPLNAILGFSTLAQKKDLPEAQRSEYLGKIRSSGELLLNLIDDTLTVSKANSGKLELHPEPIRTSDLLDAVIVPVRGAAAEKNVTLSVDSAAMGDRMILADKLNVQKIFLNLLTNAVKYTPPGGHVWFSIAEEAPRGGPAGPAYRISVRDDGIGISGEFLPHIFEPFAQEKRHGYESVGTGLGLSIVRQLVDLMGGSIEVQSEKNIGSEFTVRLHFQEAADAAPAQAQSADAGAVGFGGRKILLCEDNALNREIADALLREKGAEAVEAEDGEIGVRKFAESAAGEFSAVLMDVRMPNLDGIEATKRIRSLPRADAGTVPIFAMTADAFEDDVQRCLAAGMNGHIAKPIDPELLYRTLAGAFSAAENADGREGGN